MACLFEFGIPSVFWAGAKTLGFYSFETVLVGGRVRRNDGGVENGGVRIDLAVEADQATV